MKLNLKNIINNEQSFNSFTMKIIALLSSSFVIHSYPLVNWPTQQTIFLVMLHKNISHHCLSYFNLISILKIHSIRKTSLV